jgi:hypothetical protein
MVVVQFGLQCHGVAADVSLLPKTLDALSCPETREKSPL